MTGWQDYRENTFTFLYRQDFMKCGVQVNKQDLVVKRSWDLLSDRYVFISFGIQETSPGLSKLEALDIFPSLEIFIYIPKNKNLETFSFANYNLFKLGKLSFPFSFWTRGSQHVYRTPIYIFGVPFL